MRLAPVACVLLLLLAVTTGQNALAQCPGEGNCLQPSDTPGCDDEECCQTVCLFLPSCCQTQWDADCVLVADDFCTDLCGSSAAGSCFSANQTAGCNDPACCEIICPIDPFCCQTQWDASCAATASFLCSSPEPGTCGDPAAGSCFETHGTPACDDLACCETVCALSPSCCTNAWDFVCVALANNSCGQLCTVPCPTDSIEEIETCGGLINDPCFTGTGGTPQVIPCGSTVCGRIFDLSHIGGDVDVDVFEFEVTGRGEQRVLISFRSAFTGFAALTASACGDLVDAFGFTDGGDCVPRDFEVCVDPGTYWIVIASGIYPNQGIGNIFCKTGDTYRFTVSCLGSCAPVCGNAEGSCFAPHGAPGCEDVDCCDAVCMVDPVCCDLAWDNLCVEEAVELCDAPTPENDDCADCTAVGPGFHPFSTVGATPTDLPLPQSCDEGFGLAFGNDVWFCYEAVCDGDTVISTCNDASFDTRMAIYVDGCDGLELVACNDDSIFCIIQNRSRILLDAVCGETYYIRVGGFDDEFGVGSLEIDCGFTPECPVLCPADLNGDGFVDGADLGVLLESWGLAFVPADLNQDGVVDGADLGILLENWGACR